MNMKNLVLYLLFFACASFLVPCNNGGSNAEKLYTTIGFNSNKIPSNFKRVFDEIRGQKKVGNLQVYSPTESKLIPTTAREYVASKYQNMFDEDIKIIKGFFGDEESQQIIEAGLVMFQYADDIYKNDYPKIAELIDNDAPEEGINAAIVELEATKGAELTRLRLKTMELLAPYAEKNGVKFKMMNAPF